MKKTIFAATVVFLVMFVFFVAAAIVDSIPSEDDGILDRISETLNSFSGDQVNVPVRNADESDLPYGTVCHVSDQLLIAGSPGGGITMGWGLPDEYMQSATRYKLLPYDQHDSYAIDLSTFNQPQDVIPVYSTLEGTVIEITNPSKAGYGGFERVRNARWSCVNGDDLWLIKPDEEYCSQRVPDYMWDDLKIPSTGCTSYEEPGCDRPVYPRLTTIAGDRWWRCQTCEEGECGCKYEYHRRNCVDWDALTGACIDWSQWQKHREECHLTEQTEGVIDLIQDQQQERIRMVLRGPDCAAPYAGSECTGDEGAHRCCVQGLTESNFAPRELPELRYGKLGNYEIVQADQTTDTLLVSTDQTVDKNTQTGTMGASGEGVNKPMVHYEVWQYSYCGVLGEPNGTWSPVDPEQYLNSTSGDDPGGIPLPCCPDLGIALPALPCGAGYPLAVSANIGPSQTVVSLQNLVPSGGSGVCAHIVIEFRNDLGKKIINYSCGAGTCPPNLAPGQGCTTVLDTPSGTAQVVAWCQETDGPFIANHECAANAVPVTPEVQALLDQMAKLCRYYEYPYLDQTTDRRASPYN